MAGRTLTKHTRVYVDGYDMSGYSRSIGPLAIDFDLADLTAKMGDAVVGYLPCKATISPGTLNVILETDSDSTGSHGILSAQNDDRVVLVAIGDRAAPVAGNPAFMGEFLQLGYHAEDDACAVIANVPFSTWEAASLIAYDQPWGTLAHALAASDSDGSDSDDYQDYGAATSYGGYMVWHVTDGDGTATITMEHADSDDEADAAAIAGLTTGEIDCSSVQTGVAVTTSRTQTINRYTRWQISMNSASEATFALGFVRGRY